MKKDILFSHKRVSAVCVVMLLMDVELLNQIGTLKLNISDNNKLLTLFMINGFKKVFKINILDISDALLWVTSDENAIPRRFSENNNAHIIDYLPHTYVNKTFPDSIFALPSYCNASLLCPSTTICGKFRQNIDLFAEK